MTIISTTVL